MIKYRIHGGSNESSPHRLLYLNTWSQGETLGEGLGGVTFWEEVCQCRRALRFQKTPSISSYRSPPHVGVSRCKLSATTAPVPGLCASVLPTMMALNSSSLNQ